MCSLANEMSMKTGYTLDTFKQIIQLCLVTNYHLGTKIVHELNGTCGAFPR